MCFRKFAVELPEHCQEWSQMPYSKLIPQMTALTWREDKKKKKKKGENDHRNSFSYFWSSNWKTIITKMMKEGTF